VRFCESIKGEEKKVMVVAWCMVIDLGERLLDGTVTGAIGRVEALWLVAFSFQAFEDNGEGGGRRWGWRIVATFMKEVGVNGGERVRRRRRWRQEWRQKLLLGLF